MLPRLFFRDIQLRVTFIVLVDLKAVMIRLVAVGDGEIRRAVVLAVDVHLIRLQHADIRDIRILDRRHDRLIGQHRLVGKEVVAAVGNLGCDDDIGDHGDQRHKEADRALDPLGRERVEIQHDLRETEQRGDELMRKMTEREHEGVHRGEHQQKEDRREDQQAQPIALGDEPADKRHREGEHRPDRPVFIVHEQAEAHLAERYLKQIDQRLADEEKHKGFQRGFQRLFAVRHNDDRKEHPRLHGLAHADKGGVLKDGHDQKDCRHHRRRDGKDNDDRPAHIETAEQLVGKAPENILIFHWRLIILSMDTSYKCSFMPEQVLLRLFDGEPVDRERGDKQGCRHDESDNGDDRQQQAVVYSHVLDDERTEDREHERDEHRNADHNDDDVHPSQLSGKLGLAVPVELGLFGVFQQHTVDDDAFAQKGDTCADKDRPAALRGDEAHHQTDDTEDEDIEHAAERADNTILK